MLITTFAPSASPKYTATVAPRSQESAGGPQDLLSLGNSPAPSLEKSVAPAPQPAPPVAEPAAPAPQAPAASSSNPTSLLMETPALFSVQPTQDDPDPHHINERVRQVVKDNLKGVKDEQLTPECSYVDDLGADSLDQVELLMGFENEFGIKIAEEDAQKLTTIGATVEYVQAHYPADGE